MSSVVLSQVLKLVGSYYGHTQEAETTNNLPWKSQLNLQL